MDYNEYTKRAYDTACKHGFHDQELTDEHWLMLVITEVAEMTAAVVHYNTPKPFIKRVHAAAYQAPGTL